MPKDDTLKLEVFNALLNAIIWLANIGIIMLKLK